MLNTRDGRYFSAYGAAPFSKQLIVGDLVRGADLSDTVRDVLKMLVEIRNEFPLYGRGPNQQDGSRGSASLGNVTEKRQLGWRMSA